MSFKHVRNHFNFGTDDAGDSGTDASDQTVEIADASPITAEEPSTDADVGSMVFTNEEANMEVPAQVKEEIQKHVSLLVEQHNLLLNALQTAVNMFDTE